MTVERIGCVLFLVFLLKFCEPGLVRKPRTSFSKKAKQMAVLSEKPPALRSLADCRIRLSLHKCFERAFCRIESSRLGASLNSPYSIACGLLPDSIASYLAGSAPGALEARMAQPHGHFPNHTAEFVHAGGAAAAKCVEVDPLVGWGLLFCRRGYGMERHAVRESMPAHRPCHCIQEQAAILGGPGTRGGPHVNGWSPGRRSPKAK